jgi:NAD(P)-dependent dehydrogenase (short-subunit alcohol dehydrogenase family)
MHQQSARYPSLQDKHVFVTGGGTGIGEAIVSAFAAQGAKVSFVDILDEPSLALCERLAETGYPKPMYRHCDITSVADLTGAMAQLMDKLGDIDVLVNNAANDQRHDIGDVNVDYWDRCIAINQRPMFFTSQAALPGMKRRGGGSIVNISSISWHMKGGGYPIYATTKAAVVGLTRSLARDLGEHGIRVNTVTPGWVMTERQIKLWVNEAAEEDIKRNQCLPGKLMPEDIASMVLFLGSDDSAMCTAQEFIVDAGWA